MGSSRLVFSGDFQADVSTVNNDVRHYDRATFQPRFQRPSDGQQMNGWWNPAGSHAFRLIACTIRAATYADDSTVTRPDQDAAIGLLVGGSRDRVSGKLVDVDPQWQMASEIWGLDITLIDASGVAVMRGRFEPASFRDILFGRQAGAGGVNGQSASAMFVSVLRDVTWNAERVAASRALTEIADASAAGLLSVRLTTFAYYTRSDRARFTLGTVSGAIGPADPDDPRTFVSGRRFAPANGNRSADGIGFFTGRLDRTRRRARLDLSNALPITNTAGSVADVGALRLAILRDDSVTEGQAATGAAEIVGEIPYRSPDWLATSGGIFSLPLTDVQAARAAAQPLALVVERPGQPPTIAIRETAAGRFVRADRFLQRLDPGRSTEIAIVATTFGMPTPAARIAVQLLDPMDGMGGAPPGDPNPPTAPIPTINVPPAAVSTASLLTTDARGRATCTIAATDPANPRGYIDGQVYLFAYDFADPPPVVSHQFDVIVLHVRDAFDAPAAPNWQQHVAPVLVPFGNLYPVMTGRLVDLTSYEDVCRHRAALELALSLDMNDPNYMPVTRDLSDAKRDMLLHWLREKDASGAYVLRAGPAKVAPESARVGAAGTETTAAPAEIGGKVDFLRTLPRALRREP